VHDRRSLSIRFTTETREKIAEAGGFFLRHDEVRGDASMAGLARPFARGVRESKIAESPQNPANPRLNVFIVDNF
jgi:hypothetical protein